MSKRKRWNKPTVGYEYLGKMKGGYTVDRRTSTKMQRMLYKEQTRELLKEAYIELGN